MFVTSSVSLGSTSGGGADRLDLSLGYSTTANGTPTLVGTLMNDLAVQRNDLLVFTLSTIVSGLPAGTYFFAMAGSTLDTGWNNTDNGQTSAFIIRP